MEEIKLCPFCGSKGVFEETIDGWGIGCEGWDCISHVDKIKNTMMYETVDEAIKAWNTRYSGATQ